MTVDEERFEEEEEVKQVVVSQPRDLYMLFLATG